MPIGTSFRKEPSPPAAEPALKAAPSAQNGTPTQRAIASAEAELARLQQEIGEIDAKAKKLAIAGNNSAFDATQTRRERIARELVRIQLRIDGLHERRATEEQQAKAERRRKLEAEAAELARSIAGREAEGVAIARRLAGTVREIGSLRGRALEVDRKLHPHNVMPVAAEPVGLFTAVAGCLNELRRQSPHGRPGFVDSIPLPTAEENDDGDPPRAA